MIIIEYLVILTFLTVFLGTAALLTYKVAMSSSKGKEAREFMTKALQSGSRQRIEDTIILYGDQLDDKTKEALKLRVDELIIEEDDVNLERKINEL